MSTATPMGSAQRAAAYASQNGDPFGMRPLTPAQRRRIRHKNNQIMGHGGSGKVTPKRPAQRNTKPKPKGLAPWGMKVRRVRPSVIKWAPEARPEGLVIVDDKGTGK